MMKNKLKHFRARAELTQAQVAKYVGVTQPTYQRWEAGSAAIPEDKLGSLAQVLETSRDAIVQRHAPIEVSLYDPSAEAALSYYGEVAIHFQGGGQPLLLSISDAAYSRLHQDLQQGSAFVTVQSLANQTVVVRTKAISDLTFSSEAYDTCGPEHGRYEQFANIQLADSRDWEIITSLALDSVGIEDFDSKDVERVSDMVMVTDEQFEKLVADGRIALEDLEGEREKMASRTDKIFALATDTVYQLSTGSRRSITDVEANKLCDAFVSLVDHGEFYEEADMLCLAAEGAHRIYFINPGAIDYLSMPTHAFEEGRSDMLAEMMDELGAAANMSMKKSVNSGDDRTPTKRGRAKQIPPARRGPSRR